MSHFPSGSTACMPIVPIAPEQLAFEVERLRRQGRRQWGALGVLGVAFVVVLAVGQAPSAGDRLRTQGVVIVNKAGATVAELGTSATGEARLVFYKDGRPVLNAVGKEQPFLALTDQQSRSVVTLQIGMGDDAGPRIFLTNKDTGAHKEIGAGAPRMGRKD